MRWILGMVLAATAVSIAMLVMAALGVLNGPMGLTITERWRVEDACERHFSSGLLQKIDDTGPRSISAWVGPGFLLASDEERAAVAEDLHRLYSHRKRRAVTIVFLGENRPGDHFIGSYIPGVGLICCEDD